MTKACNALAITALVLGCALACGSTSPWSVPTSTWRAASPSSTRSWVSLLLSQAFVDVLPGRSEPLGVHAVEGFEEAVPIYRPPRLSGGL